MCLILLLCQQRVITNIFTGFVSVCLLTFSHLLAVTDSIFQNWETLEEDALEREKNSLIKKLSNNIFNSEHEVGILFNQFLFLL